MNLNYIIMYVQDINKVKAFYTDVLGMSVVEAASGPNFVTLRSSGGALIGLQDKTTSQLPPKHEQQAGSVELSFEVDDVDATWKHWKECGVELISEPVNLPFGRYFLAKDPEGHYLSAYRFASR
jgi:predicted enzyme related to lactoylglutathione lyase